MDIEYAKATTMLLAGNLIYALISLILGVIALKVIDHFLLKNINIEEEIKKGNIAAAIFASTILIFVALLIGLSLCQ
jgi:uncharacterized membrane protein YjfL (UPF0719 family)